MLVFLTGSVNDEPRECMCFQETRTLEARVTSPWHPRSALLSSCLGCRRVPRVPVIWMRCRNRQVCGAGPVPVQELSIIDSARRQACQAENASISETTVACPAFTEGGSLQSRVDENGELFIDSPFDWRGDFCLFGSPAKKAQANPSPRKATKQTSRTPQTSKIQTKPRPGGPRSGATH